MSDSYRETMFRAASEAVVRAESLAEEGYSSADLRLSWGGTTDEVAVSLVHCGTARHWLVTVRDSIDHHGVAVGVYFSVKPIAGFRS